MAIDRKTVKVVVLKGGISPEREISLLSGTNVERALAEKGYGVSGFDVTSPQADKIINFIKEEGGEVVFIALHGEFGEDGQLQEILEENNIVFTGSSSEASFLSMDKLRSKRVFETAGLKVPPTWSEAEASEIDESHFPLIVKPHFAGSSIGVTRAKSRESLKEAIHKAKDISSQVIIEKFIEGREISVGILGKEVLPVVEIVPQNDYYDFSCKYEEGMSRFVVPATLPSGVYKKAQSIAWQSFTALGCRHLGRIDMIVDAEEDIYVLEVNSIPGLTAHSLLPLAAKSAGISFGDLCEKIVELALGNEIK